MADERLTLWLTICESCEPSEIARRMSIRRFVLNTKRVAFEIRLLKFEICDSKVRIRTLQFKG